MLNIFLFLGWRKEDGAGGGGEQQQGGEAGGLRQEHQDQGQKEVGRAAQVHRKAHQLEEVGRAAQVHRGKKRNCVKNMVIRSSVFLLLYKYIGSISSLTLVYLLNIYVFYQTCISINAVML